MGHKSRQKTMRRENSEGHQRTHGGNANLANKEPDIQSAHVPERERTDEVVRRAGPMGFSPRRPDGEVIPLQEYAKLHGFELSDQQSGWIEELFNHYLHGHPDEHGQVDDDWDGMICEATDSYPPEQATVVKDWILAFRDEYSQGEPSITSGRDHEDRPNSAPHPSPVEFHFLGEQGSLQAQSTTALGRNGEVFDPHLYRCPDCGCGFGTAHRKGCDVERCSVCGTQRASCGCKRHDPLKSVWAGEWPESKPSEENKAATGQRLHLPHSLDFEGVRSHALDGLLLDPFCCLAQDDLDFGPADIAPTKPMATRNRGAIRPGLARYPGGKGQLLKEILPRLESIFSHLSPNAEYREPFLGGGGVAQEFLRSQPGRAAWINDGDPTMTALWDSTLHRSDSLNLILSVFPQVMNVGYFQFFKKILRGEAELRNHDSTWIGFAKLAIHQMSRAGMGTRSGGPMGGLDQMGTDKVDSRYNPELICEKINSCREVFLARSLRTGTCTCLDFEELFIPGEAGFYLDPPYYKAGPKVYQHYFRHEDHVRLASLLRKDGRPWLLSYDRHPAILDLYEGWSRVEEVSLNYSMGKPKKEIELLITNR